MSEQEQQSPTTGPVQHLRPAGLYDNSAYTNVVVVTGPAKTIYIGAQGALDETGQIVGKGDIAAQTEQAMHNVQVALSAAGASLEHVIKVNVYIAQGQPILPGFAAFQRIWGNRPNPTANTVLFVSEMVPADFLVMIEAVAVVPI